MVPIKGSICCSCASALYSLFSANNSVRQMKPHSWDKWNLTRFSKYFKFKDFPECVRGPLETVWWATCGSRACSWTTLSYIKPYTGNMTLSIVCYAIRWTFNLDVFMKSL